MTGFVCILVFQFKCCGWNGYEDWDNSTYFLEDVMMYPGSCNCVKEDENARCINTENTNQFIYTRVSPSLHLHTYVYLSTQCFCLPG